MKPWQPLFLFLLFTLFLLPLVVLAMYALAHGWRFPQVAPESLDSRALRYAWEQAPLLLRMIGSSLTYSLLTAGLALLLCLIPARSMARHEFPGKALLEGLLLAPALVPAMTFSMGVHVSFIRLGLADTMAGVVLVLTVFAYPYMLHALVVGFHTLDPRYAACAANLGAGPLRRTVLIELPLLLPSAMAGGVVVFLVAFSEYFLVQLIGGGSVDSYATYIFPFLNSSDRSLASVLTIVFLAVPILLFVLLEILLGRYMTQVSTQ